MSLPKGLFSFLPFQFCIPFIYSFFKNKFIQLSLAALGLRCCARAFSSCSEQGLLLVAVCGLLIVMASLVVEHRLQVRRWALEHGLSSCGAQAQLLCSMWDLPRPGIEHMSPALAGGFLTTAPPRKSLYSFYFIFLPYYTDYDLQCSVEQER